MVVSSATLLAFAIAAIPLILAPGPDTVFVLTRGVRSRRTGVAAAVGVATGVCLHTLVAAAGLAALLRATPAAFDLVRYLGAAYLLYLAVSTIRGGGFALDGDAAAADGGADAASAESVDGEAATAVDGVAAGRDDARAGRDGRAAAGFRGGFLVNALNPKVAIFFLALLPTFAGTGPGTTARMVALGVVYAVLSAVYLAGVAAFAEWMGRALADRRVRRGLDVTAAVAFVAFAGLLVA